MPPPSAVVPPAVSTTPEVVLLVAVETSSAGEVSVVSSAGGVVGDVLSVGGAGERALASLPSSFTVSEATSGLSDSSIVEVLARKLIHASSTLGRLGRFQSEVNDVTSV